MNEKLTVSLCVLILLVIVILIVILVKRKNEKEGYKKCICSQSGSGAGRSCQDIETVWKSYDNGLTEYSNLPTRTSWGTISPGDINFPPTEGCDYKKSKQWQKWDYEDLAN